MKWFYPAYYPHFRCIADQCQHNCCIGWEIDIDPVAMNRYRHMQGPLGDRLRAHIISEGTGGHFELDAEERCPMLSSRGLCDLITAKGEKALCQICRDHPRFRFRLTGREEVGLGLCCEAACRLILDWQPPVTLSMEDNGRFKAELRVHEQADLALRDAMIALAQDRAVPAEMRMDRILKARGIALPRITWPEWIDLYLSLERLEDAWGDVLTGARGEKAETVIGETQLEQMLVYFLYRHVLRESRASGRLHSAVAFSVLSTRMIAGLCRKPEDVYDIARMYSAEIEYSDENLDALLDYLDENMEVVL